LSKNNHKSGQVLHSERLTVIKNVRTAIKNLKLINSSLILITQNKIISIPNKFCSLKLDEKKCNQTFYPLCKWSIIHNQCLDIKYVDERESSTLNNSNQRSLSLETPLGDMRFVNRILSNEASLNTEKMYEIDSNKIIVSIDFHMFMAMFILLTIICFLIILIMSRIIYLKCFAVSVSHEKKMLKINKNIAFNEKNVFKNFKHNFCKYLAGFKSFFAKKSQNNHLEETESSSSDSTASSSNNSPKYSITSDSLTKLSSICTVKKNYEQAKFRDYDSSEYYTTIRHLQLLKQNELLNTSTSMQSSSSATFHNSSNLSVSTNTRASNPKHLNPNSLLRYYL
jgi:hypothetical protein